jgi:cell filamentation protein
MADPYCDPESGVLVNRFGLVTQAELERVERDLTSFALLRLRDRSLPGDYDLTHLQGFHRAIFGDIYPWAGQIRKVAISKGNLFCLPQFIEPSAAAIFGSLHGERNLRGLVRSTFLDRLAHYLGEVNALHPFREGNGRAQRAFFDQLARDAGYSLDWRRLDAQRNIDASIAAMNGNEAPLRTLLDELVLAAEGVGD